jgi:hypothetical protein
MSLKSETLLQILAKMNQLRSISAILLGPKECGQGKKEKIGIRKE